jgi:GDP-mannose 4,6-dehydratase
MNRKFKKCLITGITGSGGSYLAEYILKEDKKIKIFGFYRSKGFLSEVNKKNQKDKDRVFFIKNDLNNFAKLVKNIKKIKPDLIFHLASNADVKKSFLYPRDIILNNNNITLNLLEACRILKLNSLIIVCSTSEVYGVVNKKDIPIQEKQIMQPASPYSVSKCFQDLLSQVYYKAYGLNIIISRMFSYMNPRRTNLFQTSFANQIALIESKKKKILQHGNLNSVRTIIDIKDAMKAYWLLAKKGKVGEIYNIGGDKIISVKEFLKNLIKLSKIKIKTKLNKKLLRNVDVTLQIPCVDKFKKHTKWTTEVLFKDSMQELLDYRREKVKK